MKIIVLIAVLLVVGCQGIIIIFFFLRDCLCVRYMVLKMILLVDRVEVPVVQRRGGFRVCEQSADGWVRSVSGG